MNSILKKNIQSEIKSAIDGPLMDSSNISSMILDYAKHDNLTYKDCGDNFLHIYSLGKSIGYIPKGDIELLERIKELVNLCGWSNSNKSIRLDKTSWKLQHNAIRNKIMSL